MKGGTTLDDIAQAVSDLTTLMDRRFSEQDRRLSTLESTSGRIENEIYAIHNDIKELYDRTAAT
ncbi:MAG: hypothetical protein U0524_01095 [Candidatus Saccharimonadales bacterium]